MHVQQLDRAGVEAIEPGTGTGKPFQGPQLPRVPGPRPKVAQTRQDRPRIGQILRQMGVLSDDDLALAVALQVREDARFGDILVANGMVTEAELYEGLALQHKAMVADLERDPPDTRLVDELGADYCVRNGVLPWKRVGGATVLICSRPDEFDRIRSEMPASFGRLALALAPDAAIQKALIAARHRELARRAEARVDDTESCRSWNRGRVLRLALATAAIVATFLLTSSQALLFLLTLWAVFTLAVNTVVKAVAAWHFLRRKRKEKAAFFSRRHAPGITRLPTVSIMVALYKETEIAARLVKRMERISYPRELLDICLVVEADDLLTQDTLARADLPRWMRQVIVPKGTVKTKPRALNFALDFCKGSIIGVYDAEDAPDPDQIHRVVRRFHERGSEVACLQGMLDFYNARTNWLSRCFTAEYATWYRCVLPGIEKLGFAVPLGGTTLFFRREALEALDGWDAYNVTEDADLGIRLARRGYRTELIDTVTEEEANCRLWPWIKQRSRWIKGYAMTYGVHMRDPARLWKEMGPWKFLGVQILFLGTLSQFLLMPLLWSFWSPALGFGHPLDTLMPQAWFWAIGVSFFIAEGVTMAVSVMAVANPKHRFLIGWIPMLHAYFPLAFIAALKGFAEILTRPFYWDKTAHGLYDTSGLAPGSAPTAQPTVETSPASSFSRVR